MLRVHQSIYGDKLGSYALLKTSLPNTDLAKRICNVTDLLDRPSSGQLTQPVFRAFPFKDFYIFIKSFPDNDSGVRKGRVLSHTLIVDQNDLNNLNRVDKLFGHFLATPEKDVELVPIVFDDLNYEPGQIIDRTSREAALINATLNHSIYNNMIVWIGEDGYFSLITEFWSHLDGNLRAKLRFGVGFNPQKVAPQELTILYVFEEYESRWKAHGYCIINKGRSETLESMSSFLLAGYNDKAKPLSDMIKTFGIVLSEIEDFSYLEKVVPTYTELSSSTDFKRLIVLCDLVARYSPHQQIAKAEKGILLKQVLSHIEVASAEQILVLKNAEWQGFLNAHQIIGDQIANWIAKSLLDYKVNEPITAIIAAAFDNDNKAQWWKKAISDSLKSALKSWTSSYAVVIWHWFIKDHSLVKKLENLIPTTTQVETDLVDLWQEPGQALAQALQALAKERNWLIVHGLSTLQLNSPEESVNIQLMIDTEPEHFDALKAMSKLINDDEFIHLTVKIGEARLVSIAGKKVAKDTSLLAQFDVKNIIWRQIWLKSIEQGNKPWAGIKNPVSILFALLEEILKGEAVEPALLLILSNSEYNDLSGFNQRAKIWQYLSEPVKSGFLNESALGCVKLLDRKDISTNELEGEIRNRLINSDVIRHVIEDQTISILTKIRLFEELPALRENDILILLDTKSFPSGESRRLGKLVLSKNWRKAAKTIAHVISSREDLKPALTECKSLLGFFERLFLPLGGDLSELVSTDEWWMALTEQCCDKYSNGPAQLALWERAGGHNSDLLSKVTGREIWHDAIKKMKVGGASVNRVKLLHEMLLDYPASDELKQLKKTAGKL